MRRAPSKRPTWPASIKLTDRIRKPTDPYRDIRVRSHYWIWTFIFLNSKLLVSNLPARSDFDSFFFSYFLLMSWHVSFLLCQDVVFYAELLFFIKVKSYKSLGIHLWGTFSMVRMVLENLITSLYVAIKSYLYKDINFILFEMTVQEKFHSYNALQWY